MLQRKQKKKDFSSTQQMWIHASWSKQTQQSLEEVSHHHQMSFFIFTINFLLFLKLELDNKLLKKKEKKKSWIVVFLSFHAVRSLGGGKALKGSLSPPRKKEKNFCEDIHKMDYFSENYEAAVHPTVPAQLERRRRSNGKSLFTTYPYILLCNNKLGSSRGAGRLESRRIHFVIRDFVE